MMMRMGVMGTVGNGRRTSGITMRTMKGVGGSRRRDMEHKKRGGSRTRKKKRDKPGTAVMETFGTRTTTRKKTEAKVMNGDE